jgi:hypothetical protein
MGEIAIWNMCGGGSAGGAGGYVPPPPVQMGFACPPGTFDVGGSCLVAPVCPPMTQFRNGYCVYAMCPDRFVQIRGRCVEPPRVCRYGEVFIEDRCVPVGCPQGLDRTDNGYCHCPIDRAYRDGRCGEPPACPRDQRYVDGRCVPPCENGNNSGVRALATSGQCGCPRGEVNRDGRCGPPCENGSNNGVRALATIDNQCGCPRGEVNRDGRCVSQNNPPCGNNNGVRAFATNNCTPTTHCPRGEFRRDGRCVSGGIAACPRGEIRRDGRCTIVHVTVCPVGETMRDGHCVSTRTVGTGTGGNGCSPVRGCTRGGAPGGGNGCSSVRGGCGQTNTRDNFGGQNFREQDRGQFNGGQGVPQRSFGGSRGGGQPSCPRGESMNHGHCVGHSR